MAIPARADPTIDANKVVHIVMAPSVPGSLTGPNGQSASGPVPGSYCAAYLTAAVSALRGGQPFEPPPTTELVKYAECMRANGVSKWPDPMGGGFTALYGPGHTLNPNDPAIQNAAKVCEKKTGVQPAGGGGTPPPGTIMSGPPGEPGEAIEVTA